MKKRPPKKPSLALSLAVAVGVTAASFVLMNAEYFGVRLDFLLHGPRPVPASVADVAPKPGVAPARRVMAPDRVVIPSLGIDAPLVYVDEKTEAAFQRGLLDGVVHYPGTAMPGEPGNAYYFGHSSDYVWSKGKYKTVFATLVGMKPGEPVTVSGRDGTAYDYVVVSTRVVAPDDLSVLDQGGGAKRLLTLQTSYPVGTALKRFVVQAELKD